MGDDFDLDHLIGMFEQITEKDIIALEAKASQHNIPEEVLEMVFIRGLYEGDKDNAFNRVNSFIALGEAKKIDADLEQDSKPSDRLDGTDSLAKVYKKETPGQTVKENFKDGKNPQDKGDMNRHGLKDKNISQLKKIRGSDSATPRQKQLAHWYINMHSEEVVSEDLRKWFSKTHPEGGWKRINSKGEPIGPCAREPGEPKPKCMSNEKIARLSKKQRASAVASKRKHDSNPERQGKPINVSNFGKGKL
jgi:hypothetical protein